MKIPLDDAYWKMYTIVIQAGAILALLLLFLERIVELPPDVSRRARAATALGTITRFRSRSLPSSALRYPHWCCKKWSDKNLGSLTVIAIALLLGGIIMWIVDAWAARYRAEHHCMWRR